MSGGMDWQVGRVVELLTEIRDNTRPAQSVHPDLVPAHNRDVTDRLKAAEQCVLALTEALTGEKHDSVYDYLGVREHLLSVIRERMPAVGAP
jgi:hypothetical protein